MKMNRNGQNRLDYLAGIRGKDIGDYLPPSERIYSQVFNQTGLPSLVYTRYIPQWMSPNSDNIANSKGPFYYPVSFLNDVREHEPTYIMIISFFPSTNISLS